MLPQKNSPKSALIRGQFFYCISVTIQRFRDPAHINLQDAHSKHASHKLPSAFVAEAQNAVVNTDACTT